MSRGTRTGPAVGPAPTARVLIVDDDAAVLATMGRMLRKRGFAVDTAGSAEEALAAFRPKRHRVVVTDLVMPGLDGIALVHAIHAQAPGTPFILVTGSDTADIPTSTTLGARVTWTLGKPWDDGALVAAVSRSLRLGEGSVPSPAPDAAHACVPSRVLLVEDADSDACLIQAQLQAEAPGCEVVREARLEPALQRLAEEHFDLVLSDLGLPDASGMDAVRSSLQLRSDVPLVVLSGANDQALALEAVHAGAQDFIVKGTVNAAQLVQALRYAVQRKRSEAKLSHLARHDALTELPNRTHLMEHLTGVLGRAGQATTRFAVLFIDLDGFKPVNDRYGHAVGDALLRKVAARLQRVARGTDLVARLGGDEFAAVVHGLTHAAGAGRSAERIRQVLQTPFPIDGKPGVTVRLGASIGIAMYPESGDTPAELLRAADEAMYEVKSGSKNAWGFAREIDRQAPNPTALTQTRLRNALSRGEFELHYQPQVCALDGRMQGTEALLRWRRDGRAIFPAEFLPLLERTGDIRSVGAWVLRTACEDFLRWRDQGLDLSRVAVNVSPRQLDDDDIVHSTRRALEATGIVPEALELEVTESAVMEHPERAREILFALKRLGVRLAMDDFGTGHSSLSNLYRLPFDVVKIDRSFVQDMCTNRKCRAVIGAVVALGQELALEIVAEGVEQESQAEMLRDVGCDVLQGFLFGKAMPAAELVHIGRQAAGSVGLRGTAA